MLRKCVPFASRELVITISCRDHEFTSSMERSINARIRGWSALD